MWKMRQSDIIKQLSDRELLLNVYFTQLLLLVIAIISGFFLFDSFSSFWGLLKWTDINVIYVGGVAGVIVVVIDIFLMSILPDRFYDDGGINNRIFRNRSIVHIFILTLLIAICEEVLFRGVIQTHGGLLLASTIFALVHLRYLTNIFLFSNIIVLSLLIGVIYEVTNNLLATILMHFLIDFLLGIYIKFKLSK